MFTATEIQTDALRYNAEYPEAAAEIATAEPVIRVHIQHASPQDYRNLSVSIMPMMRTEDGGLIGAGEPTVKRLVRFSGRASMTATAKRARKYLGLADCPIPVEFIEHH